MTELLKTEELESRAYQEVIAASAMDSDTMVVLPTGLGKTVIAAMIASEKLEDGKVLFLAPTRPLVEQHLKTFKELLHVEESAMKVMTGDTPPDERYRLWKDRDVFFATPQVVENDLIANEVPVEDFSLVIFDEAHRATGEYSYVFISEKMRCQRLALTASPGGGKDQIMEVAENLGIENFEVRTEEDPDVEPYIQEKEINWKKVSLDNRFRTAKKKLEDAKREQLKELKSLGQIDSIGNVRKKQLLKLRGEISSKLSSTDDPKLYSAISHVATALKISQAIELLETQGVSQAYEYLEGLKRDNSKAAARALQSEEVGKAKELITYMRKKDQEHPKLEELVQILEDKEEGEKALVFTEYRASAEKIKEELNSSGHDAVKFIGQRGDEGLTQKQQIELLEEFEAGEHDVLVSTSVGEEGLDIPAVDYVIFYEPVPSGIRDIQRAGRTGRQESGKVYVLMAEDTRDEGYYWSAHHQKKNMNKVLEELKDVQEEKDQRTLEGFEEEESAEERQDEFEEDELVVIADDRENAVAKKLSRSDVTVRKKRLEVADFLVAEDTAVERKEAEDFVDSIVDDRLFSQVQELHQFRNKVILIEGEDLYSHRDIHPNSIRGALASITLDHDIPTVWTDGEKDTAEILKSMAKREQLERDKEVAVRGEKSPNTEKELQEFIVAGLPGVNTKIAERLLEEFGSPENVFTASETELKEVRGLGEKKASEIRSLLTREY
ncbi:MAG: DEAD/DEAH box helicase [Candidatus Nanohaloarchaea archaeon]